MPTGTDTCHSGELLAAGFQRLPKKNDLPDYYEVIFKPVAFSTVRVRVFDGETLYSPGLT